MSDNEVSWGPEPGAGLQQLSLGIALLGLISGFLLSYGVLGADSQGQVNLLFLLLLFVFLPIVSLILSLILLAKGGGKGVVAYLLDLPLWPRQLVNALPRLGATGSLQPWLFYQTQILSLSFALACLLLYLLLLLGTDLSFVWRSTLLDAEALLPGLRVIALPWAFWTDAQPSLELLQQTRDFRLDATGDSQSQVGLWWQYILAAQLCYNLLPRSIMLLLARRLYRQRQRGQGGVSSQLTSARQIVEGAQHAPLAELVSGVGSPYMLLDWAGAPASCHAQIQAQLGAAEQVKSLGPLQSELPVAGDRSLVVVVKSWEPPLAELADTLQALDGSGDKLLLPLDWQDAALVKPREPHVQEWRRFLAALPGWKLLRLGEHK